MHMSKFIEAWIFNRFQRYFFSFALLVLKSVSLNATVTYLLPVPIATVTDIVPQKYSLNLIYSPIRKSVFLDLLLFILNLLKNYGDRRTVCRVHTRIYKDRSKFRSIVLSGCSKSQNYYILLARSPLGTGCMY